MCGKNLTLALLLCLGIVSFLVGQDKNENGVDEVQLQKILKKMQEYESKLKKYEKNIQSLKEEVSILKQRLTTVEESKQVEELREEVQDLIEETETEVIRENTVGLLGEYLGFKIVNISGYYNFIYTQDDKKDSPSKFQAHELTFFFQKQIHSFNLFAEIAFEYAPKFEGDGEEVQGSGELFVEQAWLEYLYHPLVNVRAGLMLIPETWNLEHYPTTTYSTSAPLHVSRIFPREFVGVAVYGDTEYTLSEDFGVGYFVYVANGEGPNKGKEDPNENKALGGKITLHLPCFQFFDQWDVSTNGFYGKDEEGNLDFLWNAEMMLEKEGFTLHFEYAQGRRSFQESSERTRKSYGGFLELAYTFADKYTIFTRGEIFDPDRRALDHIRKAVFGVRYKILSEISLKGEFFYEWHRNPAEENYTGFSISLAALL